MSDNARPTVEPKNITMYPRHWEAVQEFAAREYDGNLSLALRRIIDEWQIFKGAHLPTPLSGNGRE